MSRRVVTVRFKDAAASPLSARKVGYEATMIDDAGVGVVFGGAKGRRRWVHVPEVAHFSWTSESDVLEATPHPDADRDLFLDELHEIAIPLFLQAAWGYEVIHAGAVSSRSGVFGFCGSSGCGKSTIAHGLTLQGHRMWADDVLALQVGSSDVVATALPFRPNLRPASRAFFRNGADGKGQDVEPVTVPPWSTARLSGLFVLAPSESNGAVGVTRLNAAGALAALLPHGMRFKPLTEQRERRILTAYVDLVACVPIFSVAYDQSFAAFPSLIDQLEGAIQAIHA